ncbi:MAG: AI-2E family transporter [Pyrinomonadaceae bacterium]
MIVRNTLDGFTRRVFIAIAAVVATLLGLTLVYFTFDIILLVFAAALLAIFLRGLAELLRPYIQINERWLVLIVLVLLIGILAGAITFLAPSVSEQVRVLRDQLPQSAARTADYISEYSWGAALIGHLPNTEQLLAQLDASTVLTRVGGYFSSTVGVVGQLLLMLLLGIYFAMEPRFYVEGFTSLFPIDKRKRTGEVLGAVYETLRWWLIGKAASMIFIGLLTWIGLSIIGVPLALTLGILAGLFSFIPNFGPILSAIPALLLAFIDSPISALYVLGLYIGIQVIESNIVTPLIDRETVELPPALTIAFQLGLGAIIGGLGLVLATPLLAAVVVLVKMVYIEDVLGDESPLPAEENQGGDG